jgi:phosphopantothenate synthetase
MTIVEIKVGSQTRPSRAMAEALTALEAGNDVCVTGINWAVGNTIRIVELIKKKKAELHQVNLFEAYEERKLRFQSMLSVNEP